MANGDHIARLKNKRDAWNVWRYENIGIRPDLSGADLREAQLCEADLRAANLTSADLTQANLNGANLIEANLFWAKLGGANLSNADLSKADLRWAILSGADLSGADLSGANLEGTNLRGTVLSRANLSRANLSNANLSKADLRWANLEGTNLRDAVLNGAKLSAADLEVSTMVNTDFAGADLTGCRIHGASAWGLKLDTKTEQRNLVITRRDEPAITVDNIEVAQFIYLMLSNPKIRDVIDTITSKAVLILGRFTDDRKAVLDALRDKLRERGYLPILFDFKLPERRNLTETVTLLARMARFVIADLTDPSSIPQELQAIIPSVRVPVQPLLLEGSSLYSMFKDFDPEDFHWVLPVYKYKEPEQLLAALAEKVIAPAENKVEALAKRRRTIDAELAKPQ
ncbi:pentapeptide repeat-containing protein [Bradyrhizobium sp.]|jgi:uncharacterized protein YjbI with pentapeptide repeats|uniref:pentapeptide repeat-containing protein n=1 Tax=Bradyrhizobium sp. TaxID=376 RepID=UPI002DDCF96A|nr:pentapeptide repeat-containing protein [Bradyrhizobium sp.]HEV2158309.1 pentapeptide repeat-containing protein [Bradyrhizobium sp.]